MSGVRIELFTDMAIIHEIEMKTQKSKCFNFGGQSRNEKSKWSKLRHITWFFIYRKNKKKQKMYDLGQYRSNSYETTTIRFPETSRIQWANIHWFRIIQSRDTRNCIIGWNYKSINSTLNKGVQISKYNRKYLEKEWSKFNAY